MLVAIAGNMGVGKTSLVEKLALTGAFHAALEPVTNNPYLQKAYEDRGKYNYELQKYYLEQRIKTHSHLQRDSEKIWLLDRSIYEGAEVFLPVQKKLNMVTDEQFAEYQSQYQSALTTLTPPHLMVWLDQSLERTLQQIAKRGRSFELKIEVGYIKALHEQYQTWFNQYSFGKKLRIDALSLDWVNSDQDFNTIKNLISTQLY